MKSFFCLLLVIVVTNNSYSQGTSLVMKSVRRKCIINLKFYNLTNEAILVPDFSLRGIVSHEFKVLNKNLIEVKNDTLIISTTTVVSDSNIESVKMSRGSKKPKVLIKYPDFVLKSKVSQTIRLPDEYCDNKFRFIKIMLDGGFLASSAIVNKK